MTVGVTGGTVPRLARLFDPTAPWVFLSDYSPAPRLGWLEISIPMAPNRLLTPSRTVARRPRYDVLLATREFFEIATDLAHLGLAAGQFLKKPTDAIDFENADERDRAARLNAFGLVVWFDLPHEGEVAQVTATSDELLDEALHRWSA